MTDPLVFYSVALFTVVSGAWGLALAYRARRRSEPAPFSPADVGAIALSVVIALALSVVVPSNADAHYIGSKCSDESTNRGPENGLEDCKHVARRIHDVFKNDEKAHRVQELGSCEGGLDKWAINGEHDGIFQFNRDARETYGWERRVLIQVRAAKRMIKARGFQPWEGGTCA